MGAACSLCPGGPAVVTSEEQFSRAPAGGASASASGHATTPGAASSRDCGQELAHHVATPEDDPVFQDFDDDAEPVDFDEAAWSTTKFLRLKDLAKLQGSMCAETAELLGISADEALPLLRHFKWSTVSLNEAFFEDESRVRRAAGLSSGEPAAPAPDVLCGICFSDPPQPLLPCNHSTYCGDCWATYVQTAVKEGKHCLDLRCPTEKCEERLRPSQVRACCDAGAPELKHRYDRFLLGSLVESSQSFCWCPGAGCVLAVYSPAGTGAGAEIDCPCGHSWCFDCKQELHAPVECQTLEKWNKKNRDESQDALWLSTNTKPCPKCKNPIEKNGGCNHMTCRPPGGCGHDFCWICLKDYKFHRNCNTFAMEESADKKDARSDLLRYAFYFERYQVHNRAQQFAMTADLTNKEQLMQSFAQERRVPVKDLEFLKEAVVQIGASRRFLKWTYAYAYMEELAGSGKGLFEFHQAELEGTLERLSDIMENTHWPKYLNPSTPEVEFYDVRSSTVSLTGVVKDFVDGLSNAMKSGELLKK